MNTPNTTKAEQHQSFRNSDNPSLVLRLLKGPRWGWPISALSEWQYNPSVYVGETDNLEQVEELRITIGLREVTVRGSKLERVCEVLEQGAGGMLIEQGRRFRALAKPTEPYIDSIEVKDAGAEDAKAEEEPETDSEEYPDGDEN